MRRFLRARNHDLVKAEDMLRKSVEWRQTNKVDDALNWVQEEAFIKEFPIEYPGVDYKNRAIMWIPVGAWHIRAMLEKGNKEEMLKYIYVCLERLVSEIKKAGEQFTIIIDLEGMTYWKVAHYESKLSAHLFRSIA